MPYPASLDEIREQLRNARTSVRLGALDQIAPKLGGGVELSVDAPEIVPLLVDALSDPDRRVQRAAARALRPFVADNSVLFDTVLPTYGTPEFDGTFSHAGLLDTRDGTIWVPRFQATKGHAALLADRNTDRFFKFEFFVPNQVPGRLLTNANQDCAHLLLHFILDWSYARQSLVPAEDGRRLKVNHREQQRYAETVTAFYAARTLNHPVAIHHLLMRSGAPNRYLLDVDRVAPSTFDVEAP